jgi:hypothetical protein
MPKHQRAGDHCVDCVIKTFKRVWAVCQEELTLSI